MGQFPNFMTVYGSIKCSILVMNDENDVQGPCQVLTRSTPGTRWTAEHPCLPLAAFAVAKSAVPVFKFKHTLYMITGKLIMQLIMRSHLQVVIR